MAAFALMLQGKFYDPITQGYALSDRDLRLYKVAQVFFVIYVTEILAVLFLCCIFWSEEGQLFKCFCFYCLLYSVHPGDLFFFSHLINVFFLSDWDRQLKETCLHVQHELLLTVVSRK